MAEAIISRRGGGAKPELKSITITSAPTKTTYLKGEVFDTSGMIVTADLGSLKFITNAYSVSPSVMTAGLTSVTVSYEFNGITKTAAQ